MTRKRKRLKVKRSKEEQLSSGQEKKTRKEIVNWDVGGKERIP